MESEKRRYQTSPTRDSISRIQEIDSRLDELQGEKESFE